MLSSHILRRASILGVFLLSMTGLVACGEESDDNTDTGETTAPAPSTAEPPASTEQPAPGQTQEQVPETTQPGTTTTD